MPGLRVNVRMRRTFAAGLAALAVLLWVAAQPSAATAQTPTPTPAATLAPGGAGRTVTVGAFFLTPDATSAPVGDVRFNVTGVSGTHEVVVVRTALLPNALPKLDNGRVDETKVEIVGRSVPTISAGTSTAFSLNLTAGNYVLLCNLPRGTTNGHYASGMFSSFEVRAGGAPLGNAAPLPAPTAAAAAAAPAAPKTGSAGLLVSDVATGGLLVLMLATVALIVGGRVIAGRAR